KASRTGRRPRSGSESGQAPAGLRPTGAYLDLLRTPRPRPARRGRARDGAGGALQTRRDLRGERPRGGGLALARLADVALEGGLGAAGELARLCRRALMCRRPGPRAPGTLGLAGAPRALAHQAHDLLIARIEKLHVQAGVRTPPTGGRRGRPAAGDPRLLRPAPPAPLGGAMPALQRRRAAGAHVALPRRRRAALGRDRKLRERVPGKKRLGAARRGLAVGGDLRPQRRSDRREGALCGDLARAQGGGGIGPLRQPVCGFWVRGSGRAGVLSGAPGKVASTVLGVGWTTRPAGTGRLSLRGGDQLRVTASSLRM